MPSEKISSLEVDKIVLGQRPATDLEICWGDYLTTGFKLVAANRVGVFSNATEQVRFDAQMRVLTEVAVFRSGVGTGLGDDTNVEMIDVIWQTVGGSPAAVFQVHNVGTGVNRPMVFGNLGGGGFTEYARFTTAGHFGVGTPTPNIAGEDKALTVSAGTTGDVRSGLELQGARTVDASFADFSLYHKTNRVVLIAGFRDGADNSGALSLQTASAGTLGERVRITSAGNVVIGGTTAASRLEIDYNSTTVQGLVLKNTAASGRQWLISEAGTGGALRLTDQTAGLDRVFVDANGNFGLGLAPVHFFDLAMGTITSQKAIYNATGTWNAAGVTFSADIINITNTASAAGSLLWDRQVGGVSQGKLDKTGVMTLAGAIAPGNTVNVVSPTAPNRTVTMVIGGTTYYLAAKTTND